MTNSNNVDTDACASCGGLMPNTICITCILVCALDLCVYVAHTVLDVCHCIVCAVSV